MERRYRQRKPPQADHCSKIYSTGCQAQQVAKNSPASVQAHINENRALLTERLPPPLSHWQLGIPIMWLRKRKERNRSPLPTRMHTVWSTTRSTCKEGRNRRNVDGKTLGIPKTHNAHTGIHREHQKNAILMETQAMLAKSNLSPFRKQGKDLKYVH